MLCLPQLESHPRIVTLARSWPGKALLIVALALLLWPLLYSVTLMAPVPDYVSEWLCVAGISATTIFPRRRRLVIAVAGLIGLRDRIPPGWIAIGFQRRVLRFDLPRSFMLISLIEALIFCGAYAFLATRFADSRLFKRPVALLLIGFIAACSAAAYLPMNPALALWWWGALIATARSIWFLGYTLLDRRNRARQPLLIQLGSYAPFWGSSNTPYPKGSAHLSKIEVTSDEELAVWQLKGLKLIAWAIVLSALRLAIRGFIDGDGQLMLLWPHLPSLRVPELDAAIRQSGAGLLSWPMHWAVLAANLVEQTFQIAIAGHVFIGVCRMAGFKALRNTYRPFSSVTIAEFFNRFYFYFKELLVDFFFFPTYLRYFKKQPKLRLFVATFAAAGFGNALFHYLRDMHYVALLGPWHALTSFDGYLLYCAVLGTAVGLSQLRGARPPSTFLSRLGARAFVFTFFAVLLVFDDPKRTVGLSPYLHFLRRLLPW